jgi:hypothetical protein
MILILLQSCYLLNSVVDRAPILSARLFSIGLLCTDDHSERKYVLLQGIFAYGAMQ